MRVRGHAAAVALALCVALAAPPAFATAAPLAATPEALAQAMRGHAIVLLGEVHDNGEQHALRLAALQQLVASGARPGRGHPPARDAAHGFPRREAGRRDAGGDGGAAPARATGQRRLVAAPRGVTA